MTAFAIHPMAGDWGSLSWEIRSVNHRYLEVSFKLPEFLRECEYELRNKARERLGRGKIECSLQFKSAQVRDPSLLLHSENLNGLLKTLQAIESKMSPLQHIGSVSALDILSWPGIMEGSAPLQSTLQDAVFKSFEEALQELRHARSREGQALQAIIADKLRDIQREVQKLKAEEGQILARCRDKILTKIKEFNVDPDPGRLEQELIYWGQKSDVAEELDRLQMHVREVERTLMEQGLIGRRLDFLMQEMNREANTLAAKALDGSTSSAAVELKVCIEQIREQAQNVE